MLLEDKRQRKSKRIKNESEEERNITLEEQRYHNLQRQQNVVQHPVHAYNDALIYATVD